MDSKPMTGSNIGAIDVAQVSDAHEVRIQRARQMFEDQIDIK
jgi:hypothetical protein